MCSLDSSETKDAKELRVYVYQTVCLWFEGYIVSCS